MIRQKVAPRGTKDNPQAVRGGVKVFHFGEGERAPRVPQQRGEPKLEKTPLPFKLRVISTPTRTKGTTPRQTASSQLEEEKQESRKKELAAPRDPIACH